MSKKITTFIGGHEGFVETWYLDAAHVPTIGYGFTWGSKVFQQYWMTKHGRKFRKGDKLSKAEGLMLLEKLLNTEYGPPVDRAFAGRQPEAASTISVMSRLRRIIFSA